MAHLTTGCRNDVQPWDAYMVRDWNGHPLREGKPIGSRVYHPRPRYCVPGSFSMDPDGPTYGKPWSYALACPIR